MCRSSGYSSRKREYKITVRSAGQTDSDWSINVRDLTLVIQAYYQQPARYSYFAGCSTGGRQGMVEASRFPDDYDGIAVGAPASNWPGLNAMGANFYHILLSDPKHNWVSPDKLKWLNQQVMLRCHGANGLLDDPANCKFDVDQFGCGHNTSKLCLTAGELRSIHALYDGIKNTHGETLYPGIAPGAEQLWSRWRMGDQANIGTSSFSYPFNIGFFRDLVYQNHQWQISQFKQAKDLAAAQNSLIGMAIYAYNPDLSAFYEHGGKLLHYHGWQDPGIPARWSIRYHQQVAQAIAPTPVNDFYRLFLGTGMSHCGGGPGPNAIGGAGAPAPVRDSQHDVIEALVRWVELGRAPNRLIATHYQNNDPSQPITAQRPWCPYPQVARYIGQNDRNKPSSYHCLP